MNKFQRSPEDDLLGGGGEDNAANVGVVTDEQKAAIQADIDALQAQIKDLRLKKKGQKPKVEKENKGIMVAFKNKKGETIVGKGVVYYVARAGGKLHYKEGSAVIFLKPDWKEGDPVVGINGETLPEAATA